MFDGISPDDCLRRWAERQGFEPPGGAWLRLTVESFAVAVPTDFRLEFALWGTNRALPKLTNGLFRHPRASVNHDHPQALPDYRIEHPHVGRRVKTPDPSYFRDLLDLNPGMRAVRGGAEELELSLDAPAHPQRQAGAVSHRPGIEFDRVGIQTPHRR